MKRSWYSKLLAPSALALLATACAAPQPGKSPSTAGDDVLVQRDENKPVLVRIERDGDTTWALTAVLWHGGDTATSVELGEFLRTTLEQRGLPTAFRAFPQAVAVTLSSPRGVIPSANPVEELRLAVALLLSKAPPARDAAPDAPLPLDLCGMGGDRLALPQVSKTLGHESTVLAVVGNAEALEAVNDFYASAAPWPVGLKPQKRLPEQDEARAAASTEMHELVVARRTRMRAKVAPAARYAGAPDSTLLLLAGSYPGGWRLVQTHSSYVPGGGCLAVRLVGSATQPLLAARAAKAVGNELDWILNEQVEEEDPRLTVLEAVTPEEAATRAAWMTLTEPTGADATDTSFVHYAGAGIETQEWEKLLAAKRTASDIPLETTNEAGQGRVWALLSNPCSARLEDAGDAGHTALALSAAARSTSQPSTVETWLTEDGSGLLGTLATRSTGAEDHLAEDMARVILSFVHDSSAVVAPRSELIDQMVGVETWDFALRLSTDGHPSWLVPGPTQHSLMQLGPLAAHRAVRRFAAGPLRLSVLSNQGAEQSERLRHRLQHLLSGLRDPLAECPQPAPLPTLSGEYEVEASERAPAVMLYTVDAKYAGAVRALASALNAPKGWLARSLNETPVAARARAVGLGSLTTLAALGFSVSGENAEALAHGITQVRALVARLRGEEFEHSGEPESAADPRQRLAHLLRPPLKDDASLLASLLSDGLSEQRLVVVKPLVRPE